MSSAVSPLLLAIDGGGTRTRARLLDADGTTLGHGFGGPANIGLSVVTSWQSILTATRQALQAAGLSTDPTEHRLHCAAGLAGTELPTACTDFLSTPHPFTSLHLKSDGFMACLGAHGGGVGAIINVGTGTVGYWVADGDEGQISGWGFPHDDPASGAWLGLQLVRWTLEWQDGRQEASPLLDDVVARFDGDRIGLVTWACRADATAFATLAPLVVEHAEQGTTLAVALMTMAAQEVVRIAAALPLATNDEPLPCCVLGGLAPALRPWLPTGLRERLVDSQGDALDGARGWLLAKEVTRARLLDSTPTRE